MNPGTALDSKERSTLVKLEAVIEKNLKAFYEVGTALMKIRDGRLYRETHKTFEAYCKEKWGFYRDQADRLISASKTVENLTPIGVKPTHESQIRPLARLEPKQQRKAWKKAVETAPDGKVTAKHVEDAAREVSAKPRETPEKVDPYEVVSTEFEKAFQRFLDEIKKAKASGWTTTSRDAARGYILALLQGMV